jgi:hypothetical protein
MRKSLRSPVVNAQCLSSSSPHLPRRGVQLITARAPVGHEAVHEAGVTLAVVAFEEVGHLVYDDVFKAERMLLHELKIEPDVAGSRL